MKIVYLSTAKFPSQAANTLQTLKVCQSFANLGYYVTLVVPKNSFKSPKEEVFRFYGVKGNFDVVELNPVKPFSRTWGFALASAIFLVRHNPDVVFGRTIPACFFASILGYNTVIEIHNPLSRNKKLQTSIAKIANSLSNTLLLFISIAGLRYNLHTFGLKDNRCKALHIGDLEQEHITNSRHENLLRQDKTLGCLIYTGSLFPHKGLNTIMKLAKTLQNYEIYIIGGRGLSSKLKFPPNIKKLSFVEPSKIKYYILSADVCILPNDPTTTFLNEATDFTSPLKLFDYMQCSKPIISSSLPVLKEIVDTKIAWFIDEANISLLKYKLANPKVIKKKGINAKSKFITQLTLTQRTKKIIDTITRRQLN